MQTQHRPRTQSEPECKLTSGVANGSVPCLLPFLPPVGVMIERPDADRGVLVPDPPLESNGYAPISRGTGEEI